MTNASTVAATTRITWQNKMHDAAGTGLKHGRSTQTAKTSLTDLRTRAGLTMMMPDRQTRY